VSTGVFNAGETKENVLLRKGSILDMNCSDEFQKMNKG